MTAAYVNGLGILGPGLPGWTASRGILAGLAPYEEKEMVRPSGARLPATERRRATLTTKLAVDVATEALGGYDPNTVATVFASSGGEVEVIHTIFSELAEPEPCLSPTRFHNSVHNTAAGYWSIATGNRTASDSICGFDDSFGAGLLEALTQCQTEERGVLLVAYDYPPVFPLSEFRKLMAPFGVGLRLTPERSPEALARLTASFVPEVVNKPAARRFLHNLSGESTATGMADPLLERLRVGNPAARSLPLLAALAAGKPAAVRLGCGMGGSLTVTVEPCR